MIILGTKGREVEIGTGEFHCPACDARRRYSRTKAGTYFTLFFIPLFRISDLGEQVRCDSCGRRYNPSILEYIPPTQAQRLIQAVRADLETGTPLEMAVMKLVNKGLNETEARLAVDYAASGDIRRCEACSFSYISGIEQCAGCGGPLDEV